MKNKNLINIISFEFFVNDIFTPRNILNINLLEELNDKIIQPINTTLSNYDDNIPNFNFN